MALQVVDSIINQLVAGIEPKSTKIDGAPYNKYADYIQAVNSLDIYYSIDQGHMIKRVS